jgi:hypothetical protein
VSRWAAAFFIEKATQRFPLFLVPLKELAANGQLYSVEEERGERRKRPARQDKEEMTW